MGLVDDLRHQAGCLDYDTERATADLLYRAADAIAAAEARAEALRRGLTIAQDFLSEQPRFIWRRWIEYEAAHAEGEPK